MERIKNISTTTTVMRVRSHESSCCFQNTVCLSFFKKRLLKELIMNKIKYILLGFFYLMDASLWASASSAPVDISLPLDHFDHADMIDISKLCSVAYGRDSQYTDELEASGWSLADLETQGGYRYGVRAQNGPLSVLSFKGSDDTYCFAQDLNAERMETKEIFPNLPHDVMHRGFHTYFAALGTQEHLRHFEEDEFLVLAGHSLGGAVCYLAGLEMLSTLQTRPHHYPSHFCSLFTLGAPPAVGPNLCAPLSRISHLRITFDNDYVTLYTRGADSVSSPFCAADSQACYFAHTGEKKLLAGTGAVSHKCDTYVEALLSTAKGSIARIWDTTPPQPISLAPFISHALIPRYNISQMLSRYRSPEFPEAERILLTKKLVQSAWSGAYTRSTLHREFYPSRADDTMFYQIWRKHALGARQLTSSQDYIHLLLDLHGEYNFLNPLFSSKTLRFFDRIAKKNALTPDTLSHMIADAQHHTVSASALSSPVTDQVLFHSLATMHFLFSQGSAPLPPTREHRENPLKAFLLAYKTMTQSP